MVMLKHFGVQEFLCKCGCGKLPKASLMLAVDDLRDRLGQPIVVHSGARCHFHNLAVGGVEDSQHVQGYAADLRTLGGLNHRNLIFQALKAEFQGIGIYPTFVHVDLRRDSAFWIGS